METSLMVLRGMESCLKKTYSQAKKLAEVWTEYAWRHIKKECPLYHGNQFQEAEQEKGGEDSGRYYNPDAYGRKVVWMR